MIVKGKLPKILRALQVEIEDREPSNANAALNLSKASTTAPDLDVSIGEMFPAIQEVLREVDDDEPNEEKESEL